MKNPTQSPSIYSYFNLLFVLFYESMFALLLLFMPLSAFEWFPTYSLMSGVFVDLKPISVGWMTVGFLAASWSLMHIVGLVIGSARSDDPHASKESTDYAVKGGPVPARVQGFLSFPVSLSQLGFFTCLALPGVAVTITQAREPLEAFAYALGFGAISYIFMIIVSYPGYAVDENFRPLKGKLSRLIWGVVDRIRIIRLFFIGIRKGVSFFIRLVRFPKILLNEAGQLEAVHFFALSHFLLTTAIFNIIAFVFPYNPDDIMPAGVYFYLAITLVIWIFGALHYQLSRFRVSPILFIGAVMFIGYPINNAHHTFDIIVNDARDESDYLLPEEVVSKTWRPEVKKGSPPVKKNLVVVTCTGGGILASGWFTLSMKELIEHRPEIRNEIRLLSTVSGSSTGAAFYLDGLLRHDILPETEKDITEKVLQKIFDASVKTSLESSTYGIAYLDFWRMVTGGLLPFSDNDRGRALSDAWQRNASVFPGGDQDRLVSELRGGTRSGQIPAVIFNTTVMEVGRRVMVTPMDFQKLDTSNPQERAREMSGYLDPSGNNSVDLSIWDAARISATFPYVTPAARPEFGKENKFVSNLPEYDNRRKNHFIDGGYYDNYGVASAMDWLDPVLEFRYAGKLDYDFDRLLIIQLRAFKVSRPGDVGGASAAMAAIAGPVVGMASVYSGAAITRDEIALNRYLEDWNRLFAAKKDGDRPVLKTAILERPVGEGPLSWHLTDDQIKEDLLGHWDDSENPTDPESIVYELPVDSPVLPGNPNLHERRIWISKFLAGEFDSF